MNFEIVGKMGALERALIWFGGYTPALLATEPAEDREPIAKLGGGVLFATFVSAVNWALAGWTYAVGEPTATRASAALLAAALGAMIVSVFDRSFLFFADTATVGGRFSRICYGAFRVVMILAVSGITAQAVMPLFLPGELQAQSLHMTEAAERSRVAELNVRHRIVEQQTGVLAAEGQVIARQRALDNLPADIQAERTAATSCWKRYNARRSALLGSGYATNEVRRALAGTRSRCVGASEAARKHMDAYLQEARNQLTLADADRRNRADGLQNSRNSIAKTVAQARAIEERSYTPISSTVLWNLVANDPGARMKWAIFSFLLVVCELLPFLQKLQAGQSMIGVRRVNSRATRELEERARMVQSEHDFETSVAIISASRAATRESMDAPAVRARFSELFESMITAFAPIESVQAMMRDLEARHVDVQSFMRRYPQYASVIAQAWSEAVKQTAMSLARGPNHSPTPDGAGA